MWWLYVLSISMCALQHVPAGFESPSVTVQKVSMPCALDRVVHKCMAAGSPAQCRLWLLWLLKASDA